MTEWSEQHSFAFPWPIEALFVVSRREGDELLLEDGTVIDLSEAERITGANGNQMISGWTTEAGVLILDEFIDLDAA